MTRRMTDAEIALHENALGPDAEFLTPATLASTGLLLVEELRVTRAELAKVRTKSEERLAAIHRLRRVVSNFLCENDHLPENDSIEDLRTASNEVGRAVKDP